MGISVKLAAAWLLLFGNGSAAEAAPPVAKTTAAVSPSIDRAELLVSGAPPLSAAALLHARRGDLAATANNFTEAAREYSTAALNAPNDPGLRMMLGVALSAARRTDLALPQFRAAVRLADDDVVALLLLQSALAEKGETIEAQGISQDVYRRFVPKVKAGLEASGSVRRLRETTARLPASPVLNLLLGDAYQLEEAWTDADTAYREARRLAPLWSKPVVNGGLSLLAQGKTEAALRSFADALRLDPANAQAQVWKGEAELRAGHNDRAIKTLQQVASSRAIAGNLRVQANTTLGMAFANNRSYGSAISALGTARKLAPDDAAAAAALGEVKMQSGDAEGAVSAYDVALRLTRSGGLFGARPVLFRALAEAQLSARQPSDALLTLQRALVEEPDNAPLWHRLIAQGMFDLNHSDEARQELRSALDLESGRYPLDTLNALAAHGLLAQVRTAYQRDLDVSDTGFSVTVTPNAVRSGDAAKDSIAIVNTPSSAPMAASGFGGGGRAAARIATQPIDKKATAFRALSALASLARYTGRTHEEIDYRKRLAEQRGTAPDWYLLADAYDSRANEPNNARMAYLHALETYRASGKVGLTEAQVTWGRKRLEILTSASYAP